MDAKPHSDAFSDSVRNALSRAYNLGYTDGYARGNTDARIHADADRHPDPQVADHVPMHAALPVMPDGKLDERR